MFNTQDLSDERGVINMAVVAGLRGLSQMEFWRGIREIQRLCSDFLIFDFGMKSKVRDLNFVFKNYNFSEQDKQSLSELCEKYGLTSVEQKHPEWYMIYMKKRMLFTIDDIRKDIVFANSVYPYYGFEYYERRNYQDKAIKGCVYLLDLLEQCKYRFKISLDRIEKIIEKVNNEIALLTGWRKSDNRIIKRIRERDTEELKKLKGSGELTFKQLVFLLIKKLELRGILGQ